MPVASCTINGCQWSQERANLADAIKLRDAHERLRHPDVYGAATNQPLELPPVAQLTSVDWHTRGLEAIAAQPARRRFTLYEVCGHLGDPPTSNGWQNLARDAHHLGLVEDVGGANSKRPGTKGSKTTLWERTTKAVGTRGAA